MKIERLPNGKLRYLYTEPGAAKPTPYRQDQILHLRWLSSDGVSGYIPVQLARDAVSLARAAEIYSSSFFANGAQGGTYIRATQPTKPETNRNFKSQWDEVHQGARNAFKSLLLPFPYEKVQDVVNNANNQLIETRKLAAEVMVQEEERMLGTLRLVTHTQGVAEAVAAGLVRQGRSGATKEHGRGSALERCRVCGAGLVTGRERTLGRCLRCPGAPDEQLAASLRQWRELVAAEQGVPASIVLTDEALVAVEERRPATEADLRDIPGFRPDKITSYGSRVLAIVAEAGTPEAAEPGEDLPPVDLPEPD
jgi:hypothetical protein